MDRQGIKKAIVDSIAGDTSEEREKVFWIVDEVFSLPEQTRDGFRDMVDQATKIAKELSRHAGELYLKVLMQCALGSGAQSGHYERMALATLHNRMDGFEDPPEYCSSPNSDDEWFGGIFSGGDESDELDAYDDYEDCQ